jgi:signal transduction histidine kinase
MLAISAVAWAPVVDKQVERYEPWFFIDLALGIGCFVLVFYRRRWPMPVALITGLLSAVSCAASGPAVLAAASVATQRRWRQIILVGAVDFTASQFLSTVLPTTEDPYWVDISVNVIAAGAVLSWGMYVGSRRELIWTLRNRAERAESEQELRVSQARGTERARIAREMHDVLAHRISQVSMHAGALAFRTDLTAEQMRASAGVIQEQAHQALMDLRGVLGVLRDGSTGELTIAPQPTYDDLAQLVVEARESGGRVEFQDLVADRTVPDAVGRTVYRIVQEGITNARKHAPGAVLSVRVSGSPGDGVDVLLRNPIGFGPTSTPGAGLGLVGLTERAQLSGGRLEHGRDGSTFVLHGWIPWEP